MNVAPGSLALIFEASISAQMLLFAGVQAAGIAKYGALRGVLSGLTGCVGLAVAINALAAIGIWSGLRDANLFFEPASAAAVYVYVAHAFEGAPTLRWRDALHLVPATLTFAAWKLNLLGDVDPITLTIVAGYALATTVTAVAQRQKFRPRQLWWFVLVVTASVALLAGSRALMMYEAQLGISLRSSEAYVGLLLTMLALSSSALLIELRYPNLLSAPSGYVKYGVDALTEAALSALDRRFRDFMTAHKPYLEPELTLSDLALRLQVPERQLSQLANSQYRMTVPALLNCWRVEEAARQLSDPGNEKAVTTIMYDAGFGSKSAFQREFQKKHGMSPTAYRSRAH